MFKGHPRGLYVAFFSNMGERFGYYTMLAIFVLYLQAKFGYNATEAGAVYGGFLFGVYFLPLLGGFIADNFLGYGKTIVLGILIMFIGYMLLALPGMGIGMVIVSLTVISLGTGFFKGNLQALVGNMYDDPKFEKSRDNAFNIFYMGINIGAFFAPSAAEGMTNWFLKIKGLTYNAEIPVLAHKFLDGKLQETSKLMDLAQAQIGDKLTNLSDFAHYYINSIGKAYNAAFAIAAASVIVSLVIFLVFRKHYKHADLTEKQKAASEEHKNNVINLSPQQIRGRLIALGLVFFVVIFFWMSFHQNGFTMTIFARDYTVNSVGRLNYIWFDLKALIPLIAALISLFLLISKSSNSITKGISAIIFVGSSLITYSAVKSFNDTMPITPQIFQHFNPIFIVFMTPVIVGFFSYLRQRGKEPSTPKKIGIGMLLTALGFFLLVIASHSLKSPHELGGEVSDKLVSHYWLISTYFTLTIAELFLSPMGISFVSKVAPPKYKGLMQGGWLAATAIGNLLAGFIGVFWDKWQMWQFFLLLVVMCLLSAIFMFSIMKRLEKATN